MCITFIDFLTLIIHMDSIDPMNSVNPIESMNSLDSINSMDSVNSINPANSIKSINFLNHIAPMKSLTILTNPPFPPNQQLFRLWLGVTEYLFLTPGLLPEVINTSINDLTFREEDLEFTIAARGWAECVESGIFGLYQKRFEGIQRYFEGMFEDATRVGNEMIATIEGNVR